MNARLKPNDIAKFFDIRNLSDKLKFRTNKGEEVEAYQSLSWYLATCFYFRDYAGFGIPNPSGVPSLYTYVAVIHTDLGSKALLYYQEMIDLPAEQSKAPYPYVVDIDPMIDTVRHQFKNFNLTSLDIPEWNPSLDPGIHRLYLSTSGVPAEIMLMIHHKTEDVELVKFRDSVLETIESIARLYNDPRLTNIFRR